MTFLKGLTLTTLLTCLMAINTYPAYGKIIFAPMLDASLALNSARYDVEYSQDRTDSDGNPINTTDESTSENIFLYAAPNFAFTELPNLWITPSIEFETYGANNLLNIDDEAFIFERTMKLYALLGANYKFNRTWRVKVKGFGRLEYNKSANDETLENGYYTYNDLGFWIDSRIRYRFLRLPMRSKLGLKSYSRRYPNATNADLVASYEAAGFDTSGIPDDLHDKDITVGEGWLRQELTWGYLPILTNVEVHLKNVNYTEQRVMEPYETFGSDIRQDIYLDTYVEVPFLINKYHQVEIDYAYRVRGSNQNYQNFSDSIFIEGYYNYLQHRVRLLYNFGFAFKITGFSPKGSISYTYQHRLYPSRPSKQKVDDDDTDGTYRYDDPHHENTHDFGLTVRQPLFAKWFNVFMSFHTITQASNTTVEDNASYNYKYNTFTLGTAFNF